MKSRTNYNQSLTILSNLSNCVYNGSKGGKHNVVDHYTCGVFNNNE